MTSTILLNEALAIGSTPLSSTAFRRAAALRWCFQIPQQPAQRASLGKCLWVESFWLPKSKGGWSTPASLRTRSVLDVVVSDCNSCTGRRREAESSVIEGSVNRKGRDDVEVGDGERSQPRRVAVCLLASVGLAVGCGPSDSAFAFSLGFPGVREWLRGQKQKTASFLLAPINASRDRLGTALLLISAEDVSSTTYEEAGRLVKVAARDCMPLEAGSILEFQSRSGVEVCTFKLVLNNAASLLDTTDPTKLKAEESLKDLIRSFVTLDEVLASGASGSFPDRKNLVGALAQTSGALDLFEGEVRACLGIA